MAYENKPNTGALFKRDKASESTPDYSGPFYGPYGTEMEIAAWLKTSANGVKYMSVKVSEKWKRAEPGNEGLPEEPETGLGGGDLDDSIPFACEWRG